MLPIQFVYPEDRNGTNPENRIVDERHTITPANGADFNFIIPRAAPYFESSMVVKHVASGTTLIKGIDWVPSYKFEAASNTTPFLQVYGSISILTTTYDGGTLSLEYQTLGGAYVLNEADLTTVLANTVIDPRLTSWESVTLIPGIYLPEPHLHNVIDTIGYDDLVAAVVDFKDTYITEATRLYEALMSHVQDINNPHDTDLVKLGIDRFQNVYLALIDNIESATPSDTNYVSAATLKHFLNELRTSINGLDQNGNDLQDQIDQLVFITNGLRSDTDTLISAVTNHTTSINTLNGLTAVLRTDVDSLEDRVTVLENSLGNLSGMVGDRGDVAFYLGTANPLEMESGQILNRVAVVNNASDLIAQLAYRESFAEVFNTWRRIAFSGGSPTGTPSELTGWAYDPATDKVSSTINSNSYIGLQSPETVEGDYVFEVGLSSTNPDDDYIGVSLGLVQVGSGFGYLVLSRTASVGAASFILSYLSSTGNVNLVTVGGIPSFADGWLGYSALGEVLLKVTRTGSVLTMQTSDAGAGYSYTMHFDLASDPRTVPFTGAVNLGYMAMSQAAATWTTIQRTGANPVIAATHTAQVHRWNGTAYAVTGESLADVIRRGRFYQNPMNKRVYYGLNDAVAGLISGDAAAKNRTSSTAVLDRVAYVDNTSRMAVGNYIDHWSQNPTTGAITYRGMTYKLSNTDYDVRSAGSAVHSTLWLGDEVKRHAAVRAENSGAIGFTNPAGSLVAYLDAAGVFQHQGINRTSDVRVKDSARAIDYDEFDVDSLDLFSWVWANDLRVPENLWGRRDTGVIAQQVAGVFPNCVSTNSETGLLTVDDAKLATHLSIILLKKLKALTSKE